MSDVEPLRSSRRSRVALGFAGLAALAASGYGVYLARSDKGMPSGADPQTIVQPASQPQPVPALHFLGADGKRLALADIRGNRLFYAQVGLSMSRFLIGHPNVRC